MALGSDLEGMLYYFVNTFYDQYKNKILTKIRIACKVRKKLIGVSNKNVNISIRICAKGLMDFFGNKLIFGYEVSENK